jgi:hypothetical protein
MSGSASQWRQQHRCQEIFNKISSQEFFILEEIFVIL